MKRCFTSLVIGSVVAAIAWGIAEFASTSTIASPIDRKIQVQFSRIGQ